MDYKKGYVFELMAQGGPTDNREPYFKDAVDEMMRARTLCAKANACMPDDPSYVGYLEELFDRKLDDVRILTPFTCSRVLARNSWPSITLATLPIGTPRPSAWTRRTAASGWARTVATRSSPSCTRSSSPDSDNSLT